MATVEKQLARLANDIVDDLLLDREQWCTPFGDSVDLDWSVMTAVVRQTLQDKFEEVISDRNTSRP